MKCLENSGCPTLYFCINEVCQHRPLAYISPNFLFALLLVPLLVSLSNRIGIASTWLIYPVCMLLMCYHYAESFSIIAPIALSGSLVAAVLAVNARNQSNSGPAANYYIINTTIPVFVVGFNIGLKLSAFLPFGSTSLLALLLGITFLIFYVREYKEIRADQKIADGHFRKLLPDRLRSPRKKGWKGVQIQMSDISQADSQYDAAQKHLTPSIKLERRLQLLEQLKNHFPITQFMMALLCFAIYESLCLSLPPLITFLGIKSPEISLAISYSVLIVLVIAGEFYLYKFYVEPVQIQQQQIKLNLGLQLNGNKMLKICLLGFVGSILEGTIGFGFCQILIIYLVYSRMKLHSAFATCGFFTLFLSLILTLNRVFCDRFDGLQFLAVFSISLGLIILCQYCLNVGLMSKLSPSTIDSSVLILCICVQVFCILSVAGSTAQEWVNFSSRKVFSFGSLKAC